MISLIASARLSGLRDESKIERMRPQKGEKETAQRYRGAIRGLDSQLSDCDNLPAFR
jgi:hypothetical protein